MDDLTSWIRLTKTGASASRLNRLLEYFGSPDGVFGAPAAEICSVARCSAEVARKLQDPDYRANERDLKLMERLEVRLIPRGHADYPPQLAEIADPPPALYVRGNLLPADRKAVAIVGSRQATDYGKRQAERFARELVEAGYTVVSGLARGTDTAAHQSAVKAGGRTLACLGCGVDVAYPYENRELAKAISASGALISEYPMTSPPEAWHFPSRNRIISGLSLGVIVMEAPKGSGALITAECAVDQNREVFAVPGNIDNPRNRGPHALIKDGAKLVESIEDVLAELLPGSAPQPRLDLELPEPMLPPLTETEAKLYGLLGTDPKPVDDLILESELPASTVSAALTMLEMKGVARRLPGNSYVRTQ